MRIQSQKSQNEQSSSKDVHLQAAIGHWPTRQGTQMIQTRQKSPTIERERESYILYTYMYTSTIWPPKTVWTAAWKERFVHDGII